MEAALVVRVEYQRDDAARHAGGHARAAQREELLARHRLDVTRRQQRVEIRVQRRVGRELVARRDDVRLCGGIEPRRSARAEIGDAIVVARDRVVRGRGADGDCRRRVARRRDARVADGAGLVLAGVSGGRDDDEAGRRRFLHRLHKGIVFRGRENRVAERQVDDLDVEVRLVGDHVLDRLDDVARLAFALPVEHLQADEVDFRRDALKLVGRLDAAAADQAGDVRAVAVVVERRDGDAAAREIVEAGDAAQEVEARGDAGIDDRDADARRTGQRRRRRNFGKTERLAQRRDGAGSRRRGRGRRTAAVRVAVARGAAGIDVGVERHRVDPRMLRELGDVTAVHFDRERVDKRMLVFDPIAMLLERLANLRAIAGFDRENDLLGGSALGERLGDALVDLCVRPGLWVRGKCRRTREKYPEESAGEQPGGMNHEPQ